MRAFLPLTAVAALALAGCDSSRDEAAAEDMTTAEAAATGQPDMATPANAQAFVDAAAASDMFEVESSKLAETKGKDPAVKDFAAMMVKDHTKSSEELKAAAAKASPPPSVAPKLSAAQQAGLDALKAAGDDFDRLYAQKQVAAHEQALAMLRAYAEGGDAAPLKDFAGKTAPVVAGHLDAARKLAK